MHRCTHYFEPRNLSYTKEKTLPCWSECRHWERIFQSEERRPNQTISCSHQSVPGEVSSFLHQIVPGCSRSSWGSLCSSQCLWWSAGEKCCSALSETPSCLNSKTKPQIQTPLEHCILLNQFRCFSWNLHRFCIYLIWKPLLDSWRAVAQSAGRCGVIWCVLSLVKNLNSPRATWMDPGWTWYFHAVFTSCFFLFVLPKYLEFDRCLAPLPWRCQRKNSFDSPGWKLGMKFEKLRLQTLCSLEAFSAPS